MLTEAIHRRHVKWGITKADCPLCPRQARWVQLQQERFERAGNRRFAEKELRAA